MVRIYKYISISILGICIGAIFPLAFVVLDLGQLGLELNYKNFAWVLESQDAILFNMVSNPIFFAIIALLFLMYEQKNERLVKAENEIDRLSYEANISKIEKDNEKKLLLAQKEIEETLRVNEGKFRALTENTSDITIIVGTNGKITYLSPSFLKVFGENNDLYIGPKNWSYIDNSDYNKIKRGIILSARISKTICINKIEAFSTDGEKLYFEVYITSMVNVDGVKGIVLNAHNVTDRVLYEKEIIIAKEDAESANQAKTEFLANMSHEMRTPLNAILGITELLNDYELDGSYCDYIDVQKKAGQSLLMLINDILDLSKIEAGQMSLEHTSLDLKYELNSCVQIVSAKINSKPVKINFTYDEKLSLYFLGDSARIGQVILNLLSNAFKFTKSGDIALNALLIEKGSNDEVILIEVIDEGIGISKDNMKLIFESFTQENASITRKFGGSGLGLSISNKLVKMMNSELQVESEVDKGSRFFFELILEVADMPESFSANISEKDDGIKQTKTPKILVVEDSEDNRVILSSFLKKYDYEISFAENGLVGYEKFQSGDYDLVFMDIQMPVMDGYESTSKMRAFEKANKLKKVPIIALTANTLSKDIDMTIEVGCDDCIIKPFKRDKILKILKDNIE